MFKTGQKVVCIDNSGHHPLEMPLIKGDIYTVMGFHCCPKCNIPSIIVNEIPDIRNMHCDCGLREEMVANFKSERFRGLKEDSNYATETLKDIRILQLEEQLSELKKLTELEPLS